MWNLFACQIILFKNKAPVQFTRVVNSFFVLIKHLAPCPNFTGVFECSQGGGAGPNAENECYVDTKREVLKGLLCAGFRCQYFALSEYCFKVLEHIEYFSCKVYLLVWFSLPFFLPFDTCTFFWISPVLERFEGNFSISFVKNFFLKFEDLGKDRTMKNEKSPPPPCHTHN